MERDRFEQIERLYHAALERELDAREAFLDEACADDEDLRREVAGLIACDIPNDSFIQSPAIEIAARALAADQNELSLPKLEPRPTPETLNTNIVGGDEIKNETKSGSTGLRQIISVWLVGLFFTLMCVSIGVNCYYSILYFTTAGDPGWGVGMDGRVRTYGGVSGADVSELRDGDELVSLDGREYRSFRQYFETFARHAPGAAYTMAVRRDGQMENTEKLTLHTASYHLWVQIIIVLTQLVIPTVFLLTGLAIFLLRRDDKQALLLALVLGAMPLSGWPPFSLFFADMPRWLVWMMAGGTLVRSSGLLPMILHFFLIFPERSPLLRRYPRLEYCLYPFFSFCLLPVPSSSSPSFASLRLRSGWPAFFRSFNGF